MAAKVLSVALVALLAYQVSASPFVLSGSVSTDTPAVPRPPRQGIISGLFNRWNTNGGQANVNLPNVNLPNVNLPNVNLPNVDLPSVNLPNVNLDVTAGGDDNFLTRTASTVLGAIGNNVKSSTNIATSGVTATEGAVKAGLDLSTGIARHVNKLGADLINAGVNMGKNGADIGNTNTKATLSIAADGLISSMDGLKKFGGLVNDWRARARDFGSKVYNGGIDTVKGGIKAGAQFAMNAEDAKTRLIHAGLNGAASLSGSMKENIDAGLVNGNANLQAGLSGSATNLRSGLNIGGGLLGNAAGDMAERIAAIPVSGSGAASFQLTI